MNFHFQNALNIESKTDYEFTDEEHKMLNSTPISAESDALYIRHLLEFLYKDDLNILNKRSLTGHTPKKCIDHKCITPEKKEIIFDMFTERLQSPKISLQEKAKRIDKAYVGRRIAVAIGTIRKSMAKENSTG